MEKLKSELTWSFSRDRLFSDCRRAYFFHYYASWGGWKTQAPEFNRKAYILKNIRNVDAWIGDIVHQIIGWVLKSKIGDSATLFKDGRDIPYKEAAGAAKKLLVKAWEQSRSKSWENSVKHNLNLFEHYYNHNLTREELRMKLEKVPKSIKNFYNSGLPEKLSGMGRENFLSIEELDSFEFEGVKVFAVPDFAMREGGKYLLYDWKTGRQSENDTLQLSCYLLYAVNKWGAAADQVEAIPAYLAQEGFSLSPVTAIEPEKVENYIRESLKEMKAILVGEGRNEVDVKSCPKTDNLWRCKRCKFQEICQ